MNRRAFAAGLGGSPARTSPSLRRIADQDMRLRLSASRLRSMLSLDAPDRFEITGGRAFYRPVGTVSLGEAVDMVCSAIAYARAKAASTLLANITALSGFAPPNTGERYILIEKWAAAAGTRVRLAVVASADMIHPHKLGATVAGTRGLLANIFVSEAEALAWLDSSMIQDVAMTRRLDGPGWFALSGRATVWITRSHGVACDACGRTIPANWSQYEVAMKNGGEIRLDRTCLQRQMQELDASPEVPPLMSQ